MVDTRPTGRAAGDGIRPDLPGERTPPGAPIRRSEPTGAPLRGRLPTLRELAALVVNGMLVLPRNYRRGMFLDIFV